MPTKAVRDYDYNEVAGAIKKQQHPQAPANQLFVDGDHWQGGQGWIGPTVQPNEEGGPQVVAEIKRGFVSRNATREVVIRHRDGVVGREPSWAYGPARPMEDDEEPTEQEQAAIDEAEAAVTRWWNRRGVQRRLQDVVDLLLHQGRGELRLLVPRGRLVRSEQPAQGDGDTTTTTVYQAPAVKDLEAALRLIYLDTPHPNSATVAEDPETLEEVSLLTYKVDDRDVAELCYLEDPLAPEDEAVTLLRVTGSGGGADQTHRYGLGGRLLLHELRRDLLVTQQVQEQQKALNLASSMVPRTVVTAGFLERVITNAKMPGYYVADASAPGGKRFVPLPMAFGSGTTNFLQGETHSDRDGTTRVASPGVHWREPVSPKASIEAQNAHYGNILHECHQAHYLITADATASAVSRVEARVDFINSLRGTQAAVEQAGRWLLDTLLALAAAIMGQQYGSSLAARLRADFSCRLQVGQLSAEEQRVVIERMEKGLLSQEDAMVLLGVDDVDAMLQRINGQPGARLELATKQAEAFQAWVDAGAPEEFAAEMAGLDDEQKAALLSPRDPTATGRPNDPTPAPAPAPQPQPRPRPEPVPA